LAVLTRVNKEMGATGHGFADLLSVVLGATTVPGQKCLRLNH
jgi:hypothetical protein